MLTTRNIEAWLRTRGIAGDVEISVDGDIPTMPDKVIVLSLGGGPGEKRERTFDVHALQVITRGGQRDPDDAETFAGQVDDIFMGVAAAVSLDGVRVSTITRAGGPPAFLNLDESRRVAYVANYLIEAARTVF